MARLLPFVLLMSVLALFGLAWIVTQVNPDLAPWYIFALFVFLLFVATFGFLGLALYFVRTRILRRYSANWYFKTSFKMAFFVALFVAIATVLAILELTTLFNIILAILAVSLLAIYSYLGREK